MQVTPNTTFFYSSFNVNFLNNFLKLFYKLKLGGCYTGQIQWWDSRSGPSPVSLIDVDNCHIEPVYSTVWVASKTESEIMTTSADGTVKVSCQSVIS